MASLVLGAVGAVVSTYFGMGPAIGWAVGSGIGSVVGGNKKIDGPRLSDLKLQRSAYGAPIPIVFGTIALSGNVVDQTDLHEDLNIESQGKGGGTDTVVASYSASFAILVCEGPIIGIPRIWANGRLIYDDNASAAGSVSPTDPDNPNPLDWQTLTDDDWRYYVRHAEVWSQIDATPLGARQKINAHSQGGAEYIADWDEGTYSGVFNGETGEVHEPGEELPDLPITIYLGDEEQLPDPTLETIHGVGNVPGYRGRAYVVFTDLQLAEFGNTIPAFEFEVVENGEILGFRRVAINEDEPIQFKAGEFDGTQDNGVPGFVRVQGGVARVRKKATEEIYLYDAVTLDYIGTGEFDETADKLSEDIGYVVINTGSSVPGYQYYFAGDLTATGQVLRCSAVVASIPVGSGFSIVIVTPPSGGSFVSLDHHLETGEYVQVATLSADKTRIIIITGDGNPGIGTPYTWNHWVIIDATDYSLVDSGTCEVDPDDFVSDPYVMSSSAFEAVYTPAMLENSYTRLWIAGQHMIYYEINPATKVLSSGGHIRFGAFEPSGKPMIDITYSALYADNGEAWVIGSNDMVYFRIGGTEVTDPTVASVLTKLSIRAGLTADDINVVDQEDDFIPGYLIANQMPVRSAIEPLMPVFFFDPVESDNVVKFVQRGAASIVDIPEDDLAATDSDTQVPILSVVRSQDVDLPNFVNVVYLNKLADYQTNTQSARRMVGNSMELVALEAPMVISDEKAKAVAQSLLFNPWMERLQYKFQTSRKYAAYEPTDTVRADGIPVRITKKEEGANGVIKFDAVATLGIYGGDEDEGDTIFEQGTVLPGEAAGFVPPEVTAVQRTIAMLLDIPLLVNGDDGPGFYVAMGASSDLTAWPGAKLFRSVDGGVSYTDIVTTSQDDIMGTVFTTLGNFHGGNVRDHINYVDVMIDAGGGELSSTTAANVHAGANAAMLGSEMIQWQTATLIAPRTYRLRDLWRGRQGTEWAMGTHSVGERFVKLTLLDRVFSTALNVERHYKAVSFGKTLASTDEIEFTDTGISQKPYSPTHVGGGRDASGDIIIEWTRRSRLTGTGWMDPPLGEAVESYSIDIMDGVTVKRTLTASSPTVTYTTAQQTTDFGSPQASVDVNVYQISATVGRGYAGTATI